MTAKTVTVIDGDLLDVTEGLIAHQVNCRGVMGAGVALAIAQRYPVVEHRYERLVFSTHHRELLLGHTHTVVTRGGDLCVANVFGQLDPGPATDYDAVRSAIAELARVFPAFGFSDDTLHVPYLMGCGIGGGDWDTYSAILCEEWPGDVVAHRLVP